MLEAQNLACRRGGRRVFREVGFRVESGAALLVTGANGSGKSSLLRLLAGLGQPDQGRVLWNGVDSAQDPAAYRANLHYVGHLDAVKPTLTMREMLDYWRALRGVAGVDAARALDAFGIGGLADRPVRSLSAGQKRRLSLTRLALHQAILWLLDEPTTALDRAGQILLGELIARHRAAGGIVVVATHEVMDLPGALNLAMGAAL